MSFSPSNTLGPFLATNQTFSEDWKQFLLQITKFYSDAGMTVNAREIALFDLIELSTGQQWFSTNATDVQIKRLGFRQVYSFGAIPSNTPFTIEHGIIGETIFTHIYGAAITATPVYLPLPLVDTVNVTNQISLTVDATNINITTGATSVALVSGVIVLEYLKN